MSDVREDVLDHYEFFSTTPVARCCSAFCYVFGKLFGLICAGRDK